MISLIVQGKVITRSIGCFLFMTHIYYWQTPVTNYLSSSENIEAGLLSFHSTLLLLFIYLFPVTELY